jgi:hypothetical protein
MNRTEVVLAAVRQRISDQGDMEIRISWRTWRTILRACGIGWEMHSEPDFREIDATALEAMIFLASERLTLKHAVASYLEAFDANEAEARRAEMPGARAWSSAPAVAMLHKLDELQRLMGRVGVFQRTSPEQHRNKDFASA